jgi:hypothetical protein
MRERARSEARGLGAGRFTLDRSLTLALLRSAKGDPAARARAKAMLDAQERAAIERDCERALAIVNGWRGDLALRHPDAFQSVKTGPNAYAARVEAPADPAAKFWGRNVPLALEVLREILGQGIPKDSDVRHMRLRVKAATVTIKAAVSTDKNMLKAPPRAGDTSASRDRSRHDRLAVSAGRVEVTPKLSATRRRRA